MTCRLIVQQFVTLDGYPAGLDGSMEFMASAAGGPAHAPGHVLETEQEPVADQLNATPKLVFSGTLERAPWGKWDEATVVNGDATAHICKLKSEAGENLILWGSLSLAQALGTAGLTDEYQLRVCPAVLREGRTVWAKSLGPADLELLAVKSCGSGVAQLRSGTGKS